MDNVVTSLLILEGDGVVSEQAGGYSDWEARGGSLGGRTAQTTTPPHQQTNVSVTNTAVTKKNKLSYKQQRELDSLPAVIEKLEQRQMKLEETIAQPGFYQGDHAQVQAILDDLASVQTEMESTFERWTALEDETD